MSFNTPEVSPGVSPHTSRYSRPDLSTMDAAALEHLLEANSALFSTGEGADVIIMCKEEALSAHKAIICRRSGFLMKACFRNTAAQATGMTTIDLQDQDTAMVKRVIRFLYKLTYLQDQENQLPTRFTSPVLHAQMFATGITFDIISLRQNAINKLTKWLEDRAPPTTRPVTPLFARDSFLLSSDIQPLGSSNTANMRLPQEDLAKLIEVIRVIWATNHEETLEVKNLLFGYVKANLEPLSPLPSFAVLLNSGIGFANEWLRYQGMKA